MHTLQKVIARLQMEFQRYKKVYVFSPKGDHLSNLIELGILDYPDLTYSLTSLNVKTKNFIKSSMYTYEEWIEECDESFFEHLVTDLGNCKEGEKILITMPFPNKKLQDFLQSWDLKKKIDIVEAAGNYETLCQIEDKIYISNLLLEIFGGEDNNDIVIPFHILKGGETYHDISVQYLNSDSFFLQRSFSNVGGNWTVRVENEASYNKLVQDPNWKLWIEMHSVKASKNIKEAYPSNSSGCVVPISKDECIVLIDKPSRKPVNVVELGGTDYSSAGNSWVHDFPHAFLSRYKDIMSKIGSYLYQTYRYIGLFGVDFLIQPQESDGFSIFVNEINPRWQGTTPYQTLNSLMNNLVPLELIHYLIKFNQINGESPSEDLLDLVRSNYNQEAIQNLGGFYLKLKSKNKIKTLSDLNGCYSIDKDSLQIRKQPNESSYLKLYLGDKEQYQNYFWIRGPAAQEKIGGEYLSIGYVFGPYLEVFEKNRPEATPLGKAIYNYCIAEMFPQ